MGKFVISTRKNGEFQFNLKSETGENLLISEGYTARANCTNGIESVRKNAQIDKHFERKKAANGKFFFNLKSSNGQVIATSEMFSDENSRENRIEMVKKNASGASMEDAKA
jgi:uncharacterized protein YegP (UPF0339 family)